MSGSPEIRRGSYMDHAAEFPDEGTYGWTCRACRHWNPPEVVTCQYCPPRLTQTDITEAIEAERRGIAAELERALDRAACTSDGDPHLRLILYVRAIARRLKGTA